MLSYTDSPPAIYFVTSIRGAQVHCFAKTEGAKVQIFWKLDFNQPNEAPKPINNKKGIKKIEINLLKKGGPTEILVSFITSKKIG